MHTGLSVKGAVVLAAATAANPANADGLDCLFDHELGRIDMPDYTDDIKLVGDYAYLAVSEEGLHIVDVSDPTAPTRVGSATAYGYAQGIDVVDSIVYLATGNRLVVLDASGYRHADGMISTLREHTDAPVHAIVYSHGHHGYNAAVDVWQRHCEERGDPPPRLVGHENVLRRYARYRETQPLQLRMVSIQFPAKKTVPLERLAPGLALHDPTEAFSDRMTLVEGTPRVELIWAPSETDDALAVWLPDDGLLCGGAATPGLTIPNIGTPLRTQRFTIRWADTLDRLAELGATRLLTEFGPLVEGDDVESTLAATSKALRWLRDEVVRRMNAGMDEAEILADMQRRLR